MVSHNRTAGRRAISDFACKGTETSIEYQTCAIRNIEEFLFYKVCLFYCVFTLLVLVLLRQLEILEGFQQSRWFPRHQIFVFLL